MAMEDTAVSSVQDASKDESLETSQVQQTISLLLAPIKEEDCVEGVQSVDYPLIIKSEESTMTVENSVVTTSIPSSGSPLGACQVTLADADILLENGDAIQNTLESTAASEQLEDGANSFTHTIGAVDESDSSDAVTQFIDGQAVQLEDGTTAFIHTTPREGLQAVQLVDGTMAYLSHTGADLFNGEASGLELDSFTVAQIPVENSEEKDNRGAKPVGTVENSTSSTNSTSRPVAVGEKAFRCPYEGCFRLYTTLHHLKVHERSHTGDRPFPCTFSGCSKAFATAYGLKSHTRVHTGETPYKCPEIACNKAFKTSGDLQKHVRTHTGERPFKCPFSGCDRAFTTSNIRKVHIRTHTGERPYVCKEDGCNRAFASATNFKNHIRIHTGEKPYVCSMAGCNKRFTEYSSLYKHNVVHTHAKPYTCHMCSKTYRQTSTLAMHKRTVHGIIESGEEANTDVSMAEDSETATEEDVEPKNNRIEFQLETDLSEATNIVIQSVSGCTNTQTHPLYTVQVQRDPNLSTATQHVLVVTDPSQLVALQQLAQQQLLSQSNGGDGLDSET